jgi:hypothetical protein
VLNVAGWPDRKAIGIARAKAKIGLQIAYNIRGLVTLERMAAA